MSIVYKKILRKSRVSSMGTVGNTVKMYTEDQQAEREYLRVYIQSSRGTWWGQTIERHCLEYPENIVGGEIL